MTRRRILNHMRRSMIGTGEGGNSRSDDVRREAEDTNLPDRIPEGQAKRDQRAHRIKTGKHRAPGQVACEGAGHRCHADRGHHLDGEDRPQHAYRVIRHKVVGRGSASATVASPPRASGRAEGLVQGAHQRGRLVVAQAVVDRMSVAAGSHHARSP